MDPAADRIPAHYEKHALQWDADRRRLGWNDFPWLSRFEAALPRGGTVLDLGCGGGDPVARYMVACGHSVAGVDASATLLRLCRERMPEQDWIEADMRGLSLARRFEGVLAWDSFFHLTPDNQRAMFAVFAAHLVPGGLLLFNGGPEAGEAIGEYRGDPLYHASLAPSEYAALLRRHGLSLVAHALRDLAAGGRSAWLARASLQCGEADPHQTGVVG